MSDAPATAANSSEYAEVDVSLLSVGHVLQRPLYEHDDQGTLLLAAQSRLTENVLALFRKRGIERVFIHRAEMDGLLGHRRAAGPSQPVPTLAAAAPAESSAVDPARSPLAMAVGALQPHSFLHRVQPRSLGERPDQLVLEFHDLFRQSAERLAAVYSNVVADGGIDSAQVEGIAADHLSLIKRDLDLASEIASLPIPVISLPRQSAQLSQLASAMGALLGFGKDELSALGQGCLIHEAGMLRVLERLRSAPHLRHASRLEVMKHPIYSFDMMTRTGGVSYHARQVAYQVHERLDGSGFPRGRTRAQIHPLAKIASVADAFLTSVSPRPNRPGNAPYRAMEQLLQGAHRGLYEPSSVRALLHLISLFPIGSEVLLSDGRRGRVVRSNGANFTRPVVQVEKSGATERIDLAHEPRVAIRSLAPFKPLELQLGPTIGV